MRTRLRYFLAVGLMMSIVTVSTIPSAAAASVLTTPGTSNTAAASHLQSAEGVRVSPAAVEALDKVRLGKDNDYATFAIIKKLWIEPEAQKANQNWNAL